MRSVLKYAPVLLLMFCLTVCVCTGVESSMESMSDSDTSTANDAARDLKFAEILTTRAVPAIFEASAALDTAFYYGNPGTLAKMSGDKSIELTQVASLVRGVNISSECEPIREEFLSRMNSLISEVKAASSLKQGCSSCVADIKRIHDHSVSLGIWTIERISEISRE